MQVRDPGYGHNGSDARFLNFHLVQAVKLVQLADLYLSHDPRIVVVHQGALLVHPDPAVVHLADADAPHIFVVINRADQHLGPLLRVALRRGDMFDDGLKQRAHVLRLVLQIPLGISLPGGGEQKRAVQLVIGCIQIHQEFQNLVYHFLRSRLRPVDLVDAHDDGQIQLQSLSQHKFGLRHGPLIGVYHEDHAVDHLQHTLYLAAEIRMARGIDDIDLRILIKYGRVLGQDGDAPLPLDIVGIHNALCHFLIGPEHAALLQKLVYQSGLAMVNMGNDCNISHIFSFYFHNRSLP